MNKTIVCLCAVLFMSCISLSSASLAETKIGIFDLNRILLEVPQAKTAQQKLQEKFAPRNREMTALQQQLNIDAEGYNNASLTISDGGILRKKQETIAAEQQKLQEMSASLQRDFSAERNKALQPLLNKIDSVITKLVKEQKLGVALALTSVAYHDKALEITDQVIAEMKRLDSPSAQKKATVVKKT